MTNFKQGDNVRYNEHGLDEMVIVGTTGDGFVQVYSKVTGHVDLKHESLIRKL